MTLLQLKYAVAVADHKSMNKAARELIITQPSLSMNIKELEGELGIKIFYRHSRGIEITPEGQEFLSYARQMIEQYRLLEERFMGHSAGKKHFSVSTQHYSFAVNAFIEVAKKYGMDEYELAIHETKTYQVIENVVTQHSELGIIYLNDFNRPALTKIIKENQLDFFPLFDTSIYVYMAKSHPLAGEEKINFEQLSEYPCLSFEQGMKNSFYFAEEVFSTYDYKRIIKADDRATMLNLMFGLNGYTLCAGIVSQKLNGDDYTSIPLDTDEKMTIGYIKKKNMPLSRLGESYIEFIVKNVR